MKSLLALAFATLTFAAWAVPAEARHNFCHRYPDDPRCAAIEDEYDEEQDVYIEQSPRRFDRSCQGIARWLAANYDYRRIRATDCEGSNYGYEAVRDGWIYVLKVDSLRPRIKTELQIRREAENDDDYIEQSPRRFDRSCQGIARWLAANYGYRRIRATDCEGSNYGFEAVRDGWVYILKVDSVKPRIKSELQTRRFRN